MLETNENLPDVTFESLGLSEPILRAVQEAGYTRPMPVQAASYAPIRAGRHIVVQSRTGSGKTAAFALPLLERLAPEPGLPQVLVLAPTRELALQVHGEWERLGKHLGLRSVCIYGGTRYREQLDALQDGVHVVVGTPGRILDHWRRRTLDLSRTACLVLDEADEMLSAGFYEDIRKVLEALKDLSQVLLFSATLPSNLQNLIRRFMPDPVLVDLSTDRVDVARIENIAYDIDAAGSRIRALVAVLEAEDPGCAIIFCNMRSTTESVTNYLRRRGYDASLLNSDLSQTKREEVMTAMKSGQKRLLVATDIAARGIDISFLPCVIHYDLPDDPQLYIHRTGRTGRVDRSGRAIALLSLRDKGATQKIEWRYGVKLKKAETPTREETLKMLADRRIREIKERIEAGRVIPDEFSTIAREILTDPEAEKVIAMLVDSYLAQPVERDGRLEPERRDYERDVPPVQGEGGGGSGGGRRRSGGGGGGGGRPGGRGGRPGGGGGRPGTR